MKAGDDSTSNYVKHAFQFLIGSMKGGWDFDKDGTDPGFNSL